LFLFVSSTTCLIRATPPKHASLSWGSTINTFKSNWKTVTSLLPFNFDSKGLSDLFDQKSSIAFLLCLSNVYCIFPCLTKGPKNTPMYFMTPNNRNYLPNLTYIHVCTEKCSLKKSFSIIP
jgi:hypothetical protein